MSHTQDLERGLRNILRDQLRELVKRCAPTASVSDRQAVTTLLDQMINAWVGAEPAMRPAVLKHWLGKINEQTATARALKAAKSGKTFVIASQVPPRPPGKVTVRVGSKPKIEFDILEPKSSGTAPNPRVFQSVELRSQAIADLLKVSKQEVVQLRQKLRRNGLDVAMLGTAMRDGKGLSRGAKSHQN